MELVEFGSDPVVGGGDKENVKGNCRLLALIKSSVITEKASRDGVADRVMLPPKLSMS